MNGQSLLVELQVHDSKKTFCSLGLMWRVYLSRVTIEKEVNYKTVKLEDVTQSVTVIHVN